MIKWIGQHIVSLIARFRDDVYLENLAETTQDHVVGIDSDGKLYKQDTPSGGMTNFTVEDGDTTDVVISDGKHWKFVEGGGIDINWTDTSHGSSSDEYDLTFTLSKELQDFLIDAGHTIRGIAGSDILVQSCQDINLHLDYDQASTAGTHYFKITNGDGNVIFTIDESGNIVTRGTITAQTTGGATKYPSKGSAGNLLVDNAGAISTRPVADLKTDLALAKADVGLSNVEDKSSATIRSEIVDSDIPALNASKVTGGTFDDARIPNLGASKVTSGTFDDARIPDLGASKVTSGTFADARIPDLNTSKLTAGTLPVARGGTGLTDISSLLNSNVTSVSGNAGTATALATARSINGVSFDGTSDITVTAAGSTLSDLVPIANGGTGANNVGGARAALGVDAAGTDNSTNVTLAGTPDYITISGQEITRNQIDLTADVTGTLPVANGGTGLTSISTLLNSNVTTKETLHINIVGSSASSTNDYVGYGGHYNFTVSAGNLADGDTKSNNWASKWSQYRCLEDTTIKQAKAYVSTSGNFNSQIRFFKTAPNLSSTSVLTLTHLFDLDFTGSASAGYVSEDTDTSDHALSAGDLLVISVKKGSATAGQVFAELSIRLEY